MECKRKDFPFFKQHPECIYLDNAATTQKPQMMIDELVHFYTTINAPLHRGIYKLAEEATRRFEDTRERIGRFINAAHSSEIIFTGGATLAFNMVAQGWGNACLREGDEVVVCALEHHSNFIPWQRLCAEKRAHLKIIPVTADGRLDLSCIPQLITSRTKMVAVTHVSNALGTVVDLEPIIARAREVGARVLVDGCQAVPYQSVDVRKLDCDFYVFSGHKMMGPTGVGVLYAHKRVHADFNPSLAGGGAVRTVTAETSTFLSAPRCYEAGTAPAAQVAGLAGALRYIESIGMSQIQAHVNKMTCLAVEGLERLSRVRILGPASELKAHGHLVSFVVEGIHAHDVAAYLDQYGICVRAGNHCAQPLARSLGYEASVRASFYVYTTDNEVEKFIATLARLVT